MFGLMGSWAVGSAPALINYNLGGDALVLCLKTSGAKLLVVDEDKGCRERIEQVRDRIEGELGIRIVILDQALKGEICRIEPKRPERKYREGVKGTFPVCIFYTRFAPDHYFLILFSTSIHSRASNYLCSGADIIL